MVMPKDLRGSEMVENLWEQRPAIQGNDFRLLSPTPYRGFNFREPGIGFCVRRRACE